MSDQEIGYRAYLLRLWRADPSGTNVWHALLQSPRSDERYLFASLEQLFAFLEQETGQYSARPPADRAGNEGDGGPGADG